MGERLWDLMRCVECLASLPQVDASRLGCAGLSLGGEMAMWLGAMLTLERNGELAASATLARDAVFRDEAIELAPLTSKADWDHWFDIVLVGHFSSGDIPAC